MNALPEDQSPNDTQLISPTVNHNTFSATYQTGQTGHVDLVQGFEQSIIEKQHTSQDEFQEDEDPISQPTQIRVEPFPEERRFRQPRTPATTGQKRDRNGAAVSQQWSTPRLPQNPLLHQGLAHAGIMNASQAFRETQYSSPVIQQPLSDVTTERPSPILLTKSRSDPEVLSSPARLTTAALPLPNHEPRDIYISMKESQARRQKSEQLLSDELTGRVSSDEDFDSEGSLIRKRRLRQKQEQRARAELAAIRARSEANGSQRARPLRSSPAPGLPSSVHRSGRSNRNVVVLSDESAPVDDITEEETEIEDQGDELPSESSIDELAEDNKENVHALGIQVPRTVSKVHHRPTIHNLGQTTPSRNYREKQFSPHALTAPKIGRTPPLDLIPDFRAELSTADDDPIAVLDSQLSRPGKPTQSLNTASAEARAPDLATSSRDFVPASQPPDPSEELPVPVPSTSGNVILEESNEQHGQRSSLQPAGRNDDGQVRASNENPPRSLRKAPTSESSAAKEGHGQHDCQDHGNSLQHPRNDLPNTFSEGPRSIVPDSKSTGSLPFTNDKSAPRHTSRISITSATVDPRAIVNPTTDLHSGQSTVFETAPSFIKCPPGKALSNEEPTSVLGQRSGKLDGQRHDTSNKTTGNISVTENSNADGNANIHEVLQTKLEGSSPISSNRLRNRRSRKRQILVSSQEVGEAPSQRSRKATSPGQIQASPANDVEVEARDSSSEDELALSRPVTSSPLSSARSVDDLAGDVIQHASVVMENKFSARRTKERVDPQAHCRSDTEINCSNRVLAHFNGKISAYYPATCLGVVGGEEARFIIHFDEGGHDTVNAFGVKRLELKCGDPVKVDAKHFRSYTYVVERTGDQKTADIFLEAPETHEPSQPSVDVYGNTSVVVRPRPNNAEIPGIEADTLVVPLDRIYITQALWGHYKDRDFTYTEVDSFITSEIHTPAPQDSNVTTPTSRSVRIKTVAPSLYHAQSFQRKQVGFFSGMVFAITSVSEEARDSIVQGIVNNGGRILESRFDELFHIPTLHPLESTEVENRTQSNDVAAPALQIRPEARAIRFACVIADKHCRMAKYIQALALGIPCLSRRWITDCVAKRQLVPWSPYLLAAGESIYLHDAIVSQNLPSHSPDQMSLDSAVAARPQLLQGQTLLLIMTKQEKKTMKHMPLISHALGASKILHVTSAEEAANVVAQDRLKGRVWDWIYTHEITEHALKVLGVEAAGKKLGKGNKKVVLSVQGRKTPRIVGNEFVIQSLITGRLVED